MTTDDKIRDEKFNMILMGKHKKCLHYYLQKSIKTNILQMKKSFNKKMN